MRSLPLLGAQQGCFVFWVLGLVSILGLVLYLVEGERSFGCFLYVLVVSVDAFLGMF